MLVGADYEIKDTDDEKKYSDNEDTNRNGKDIWYEVLGVSRTASKHEIMAAWKEKIKQYHPDRVSGLGEKLKVGAEQESKKLNAAKEEGLAGK